MPFVQPTGVATGVAPLINSFNEHIKSCGNNGASQRKNNTEKSCRVVNSWVKSSTSLFYSPTKDRPSAPKHKGGKNNGHGTTPQTHPDHDGSIWIFTKTWHPVGVPVQSVIVFVHDVVEHCERYQPMFSAFAGKGIEVQSFDLPGFGETGVRADSQGITGGYDALLKEIDSAIDRACASRPQKPIFLMGHGMGGALALNYVCGLGVRITSLAGIISSSPYLKPTLVGAGSKFPATYNRLGKWYPHLPIRFPVVPEELTRNLAEQERHREDGLILDSVSMQCLGDMIYQGQKVLNKRWKHFPAQLPTLLLHGTADPICAFVATQQLSQQIIEKLMPTNFIFKSWKGGMHDPHWDVDAQSVRSEYVHWIRSNYRHYVKAPLEPEMVASIMIKSARIRSRRSSIAAAQREKEENRKKKELAKKQKREHAHKGNKGEPTDGKEIAMATASTSSEALKQLELDQKSASQSQLQEQPPATMDTGNDTATGDETTQVLAPVLDGARTHGLSVQTSSLPSQVAELHSALQTAASVNARPRILSPRSSPVDDLPSTLPDGKVGANETETPFPTDAPTTINLNAEPEVDSTFTETSLPQGHSSAEHIPEVVQKPSTNTDVDISSDSQVPETLTPTPLMETMVEVAAPIATGVVA